MTDRLAPPELRILAPRAAALGPGDSDALQNVDTTDLPDGCMAWAEDVQTYYRLVRAGGLTPTAVVGAVIQPASGPGQWIALSGFEIGEHYSYQIALDDGLGVTITAPNDWKAFPGTAHWNESDGAISGAGLITGTAFWSSATPGAGILTYHGPLAFFEFHADVSVQHSNGGAEPVYGLVISKNGSFVGSSSDLLREQQQGQAAALTGISAHLHTTSRLIAQSGDTFQLLMIDRGVAPQDLLVVRASLAVSLM